MCAVIMPQPGSIAHTLETWQVQINLPFSTYCQDSHLKLGSVASPACCPAAHSQADDAMLAYLNLTVVVIAVPDIAS